MKKSIILAVFFIVQTQLYASIVLQPTDVAVTINGKLTVGEWSIIDVVYSIPEGYYIAANSPFLRLTVEPQELMVMGAISVKSKAMNNKYSEIVSFTQRVKPLKVVDSKIIDIKALYQLCNDEGVCYLPQSVHISQPVTIENYKQLQIKLLLFYLLMAFLGGMLLNVMPCVLPVLSLKFLMVSKLMPNETKKFALNYTLGILTAFTALSIFIVILKVLGHAIGFGFHWQNYGFIIFMLMLVILMTLNLLDLFPFIASSKSPHSPFGDGLVTVLLSTPCSAPFLGVAAGWALSQSVMVIILFFIFVALGLSTPLVIFILHPKSYALLKPLSSLSLILKWLAAISLLLVARWLLSLIISRSNLTLLSMALLLFTCAIVIWNYFVGKKYQKIALMLIILIFILVFFIAINARRVGNPIEVNEPWQPYSLVVVDEALNNNQPIFINISANWCLTCRFNEAAILSSKELLFFFKEHNVLLLKADLSYGVSNEQQRLLDDANRHSLPTYLIYRSNGERRVMGELLTSTKIKKLLLLP